MDDVIKKAETFLETERLRLAARNFQHIINIKNKQVTLENIVAHLRDSIADLKAGNPDDLTGILAKQAKILDATFDYYIQRSKDKYCHIDSDKIIMALRVQRQTERTISRWQSLIDKKNKKNSNLSERTEQNAPLDT